MEMRLLLKIVKDHLMLSCTQTSLPLCICLSLFLHIGTMENFNVLTQCQNQLKDSISGIMTLEHDNVTWKWVSRTENKTQSNIDNWYHFVAVSMPKISLYSRSPANLNFHPLSIFFKPNSSFNFSICPLFWISKLLSICSLWKGSYSVQSLSHVQLFATPWTAAHQASLSITNSRSLLKLKSIESVMPSNHLILCCPPSLPAFNLSQHQGLFQWVSSSHSIGFTIFFSSRFLDPGGRAQHFSELQRFPHHPLYPPCLFPLLCFVIFSFPQIQMSPIFYNSTQTTFFHGILLDISRVC